MKDWPFVLLSASVILLMLAWVMPSNPDVGYYFQRTDDVLHGGGLHLDGHEATILTLLPIRICVEVLVGLPRDASYLIISFLLMSFYLYSIKRFMLMAGVSRRVALLAVSLAPLSYLTVWFIWIGVYAQFLSLGLFVLGLSLLVEHRSPLLITVLVLLACVVHAWSGLFYMSVLFAYWVVSKDEYIVKPLILISLAFLVVLPIWGTRLLFFLEDFVFRFVWMSGPVEYFPILVLALMGLAVTFKSRCQSAQLIVSWAGVTGLAFLFLPTDRVVFNFPLLICSGLGVDYILRGRAKRLKKHLLKTTPL